MRTRCPACSTTFRVTSEQLRLKAGKVRCGQCFAVFNAFESLIDEDTDIPAQESPAAPEKISAPEIQPIAAETEIKQAAPTINTPKIEAAAEATEISEPPPEESFADSTLAAREAGLIAARELSETPAYNRWAAGTLASENHTRLHVDTPGQITWPFVLASLVLSILLAAQLLFHFRTGLVQRVPELAQLYSLAEIDVPLPRNVDLVGIDVSDLQSDNARGLLVLQATLRNRAPFPQAWPALELTLTDTHDTVISRRVLLADEYLPPGTDTRAFPARGDMAIRLWLEAKGVGAAGYRLYLFYP